jgi:hypothetical protein
MSSPQLPNLDRRRRPHRRSGLSIRRSPRPGERGAPRCRLDRPHSSSEPPPRQDSIRPAMPATACGQASRRRSPRCPSCARPATDPSIPCASTSATAPCFATTRGQTGTVKRVSWIFAQNSYTPWESRSGRLSCGTKGRSRPQLLRFDRAPFPAVPSPRAPQDVEFVI